MKTTEIEEESIEESPVKIPKPKDVDTNLVQKKEAVENVVEKKELNPRRATAKTPVNSDLTPLVGGTQDLFRNQRTTIQGYNRLMDQSRNSQLSNEGA